MKRKDDREQFVTALYAIACKDREELIALAEYVRGDLSVTPWTLKRDKALQKQIEVVLAGIETRKAVGRLNKAERRTP